MTSTTDKPIRPTADIARRLRAGEPLTSAQVATDYGVSSGLLHATLKQLRNEGCELTSTSDNPASKTAPKTYTLVSPAPKRGLRSTWGPGENVQSLRRPKGAKPPRKQRSDKGQKRGSSNGRHPVVAHDPGRTLEATTRAVQHLVNGNGSALDHPVPQLGDTVQVYLLMLDDEGRVNVGLRNDESAWLVGVDGFAKRSAMT